MGLALLLAAAVATAPTLPPGVTARASATVEILQAERADADPGPNAVIRQVRRVPGGAMIEFS
ncbi:MAG TPA: hypothetical protein VHG29_03865 [Novosphingobium sp.]|nr:hypothetical protein [Novosphingobium sp.]